MRRATLDERKRFAAYLAAVDRNHPVIYAKPSRFRDVCLVCDQPARAAFCSPLCAERGLAAGRVVNGLAP